MRKSGVNASIEKLPEMNKKPSDESKKKPSTIG